MRTIEIHEAAQTTFLPGPVRAKSGDDRCSGHEVLIRLLGPVRATIGNGVDVPLPSSRQRALVAILAIHAGKTLRPEYLGEQINLSPGALRTSISRLRRLLGSKVVITESGGYRLNAQVDARQFFDLVGCTGTVGGTGTVGSAGTLDRFEGLGRALELWEGEALDEFRHDCWARPEVARLDELRAGAVEDRAMELLARLRHSEAIALLESHIVRYPLRDRARGMLMRALASDGRQVDALRAYQIYRRLLVDECGTEPSAEVRDIERRIALGGAPTPISPAGHATPRGSEQTLMEADRAERSDHACIGAAPTSTGRRVQSRRCAVARIGSTRWWRAVPPGSGI